MGRLVGGVGSSVDLQHDDEVMTDHSIRNGRRKPGQREGGGGYVRGQHSVRCTIRS